MTIAAKLTGVSRDVLLSLCIAAGLLVAYLLTPLEFLGNDSRPTILTVVSLVSEGDFDLDEFEPICAASTASFLTSS